MADTTQKLIKLVAKDARQIGVGSFEFGLGLRPLVNVHAIIVKAAMFCNNKYNVQLGINDTFSVSIDGNPFSTTLAPGYYTAAQILAVLGPLVTAFANGITPGATWSAIVAPYTFKVVATTTLVTAQYPSGSLNTSLGNTVASAVIPAATPFAFDSLPMLIGLHAAQISIQSKSPRTIINLDTAKALYTNAIDLIPVNVGFGFMQTFLQPDFTARILYTVPEDYSTIRMTIRDEDGNPLPDQADHLIVELMIWHE